MAKLLKANILKLAIVIFIFVVLFALLSFIFSLQNPSTLVTECVAQSGYFCKNSTLHATTLTVTIGQATGTNWSDTDILWVPMGYSIRSEANMTFCPPAGSNSVSSGISCYNTSNVSSGETFNASFAFNTSASPGLSAFGEIWALYKVPGGSAHYAVQMTTGVGLKAV